MTSCWRQELRRAAARWAIWLRGARRRGDTDHATRLDIYEFFSRPILAHPIVSVIETPSYQSKVILPATKSPSLRSNHKPHLDSTNFRLQIAKWLSNTSMHTYFFIKIFTQDYRASLQIIIIISNSTVHVGFDLLFMPVAHQVLGIDCWRGLVVNLI